MMASSCDGPGNFCLRVVGSYGFRQKQRKRRLQWGWQAVVTAPAAFAFATTSVTFAFADKLMTLRAKAKVMASKGSSGNGKQRSVGCVSCGGDNVRDHNGKSCPVVVNLRRDHETIKTVATANDSDVDGLRMSDAVG